MNTNIYPTIPSKQIRARFDESTITVYQAYNPAIAQAAVRHQTFVSPFKAERMTWIKPSFLWMMYRSGWATKENQERILAIRLKRSGFERALENACLSHFDANVHRDHEQWQTLVKNTEVRVQWDPEKNIHLEELSYRSIQIGLSGSSVRSYVNEWIVEVEDITAYCQTIRETLTAGQAEAAAAMLPAEMPYELPPATKSIIGAF
ncbi:DUF4291 domain-containing protein [Chitinophaga caseinilytica]|uniref:DUF4291 domain-containing protein n=1 Tax=Chitinophaga caseinilytica TaxID=2267521 RepID=A0ABZ2Z6D3_9BACT